MALKFARDPEPRAAWALACIVACALACRPALAPPADEGAARAQLRIVPADADVYAYQIAVRAELPGAAAPHACRFALAGREFAVPGAALTLALHAGENLVSARCRSASGAELRAPGVRYTLRLPDAPRAQVSLQVRGATLLLDGTRSAPSEGSRAPLGEYRWFELAARPGGLARELGASAKLELPLPRAPGEYLYELRVRDAAGALDRAQGALSVGADGVRPRASDVPPSWLAASVIYGALPPLFGAPPLAALTAALPALAELGVGALWLSPIFATPDGDFGYAVTDTLRVRPDYGDLAALQRLVDEAHRHGLRVLLDLVPNHTSAEHPYFRQALALGPRSHYFDFYARDAAGRATHYFDWEHLPNLNYALPEVTRYSLNAALYWLTQAQVDGYRVDAAWGVTQRRPDFWPDFAAQVKRVRADALLLAEASARDPYYVTHGFDLAYDWSEQLGHHAWEEVFEAHSGIARRLHAALTASGATPPERVFRFLNNNDTGARFITRHGEPLTRVATAALLTLPGVPCLYAFDEVGAAFDPYGELAPIQHDNPALRDFHRRLIALRREQPALWGADFELLHLSDDVYVFARRDAASGRPLLVALNFSDRAQRTAVLLPEPHQPGGFREVLSSRRVHAHAGQLALQLEPWATQIWLPDPSGGR